MPSERRRTKVKRTDAVDESPRRSPITSSPTLWKQLIAITFVVLFAWGIYGYYFIGTNEMFAVVDLPGKGKGIIALRDIKQGELVIREKPLFVVPQQVRNSPTSLIAKSLRSISPSERAAFYSLSYVNFPKHLKPEKHRDELALAIFQTNAVSAGENVGIFPGMARLNHGCSAAFNVVYSWREKEGALVIYALKSIRKGDELLTAYTDTKLPRDQRRNYLAEHYGFHCTCSVCSLSDSESRASDRRLSAISAAYDRFAKWGEQKIKGAEAVDLVRAIWRLEDEEGYWSGRGRLAADAAWVAAAHSDASAAREWAATAVEWYGYELGSDSEQVGEMQRVGEDVRQHGGWGTREREVVGGVRPQKDKGGAR